MTASRYDAIRIAPADYRRMVTTSADLTLTPFQRPEWIEAWIGEIGQGTGAEPVLLAAFERGTGALALLLPLALGRHRGLDVLEGMDRGITDYNAPVLGPAAPADEAAARQLWRALAAVMPRADLVRMAKMPARIGSRVNPLSLLPGVLPSRLFGNVIAVDGSIESHLRRSDRKARKEYDRYLRRAEEAGRLLLRRVASASEARRIMDALEHHQQHRIVASGRPYVLDEPHYARFYRRLLDDNFACVHGRSRPGPMPFADLFYLEFEGASVAFLYGLHHKHGFSLVRISHAPGEHERFSPGRIIIGETFRALVDRGVRRFDLTIGDYLSKRIFAPDVYPLVELNRPLSLAGAMLSGVARLKHEVRRRPRMLEAANRLRGLATKR